MPPLPPQPKVARASQPGPPAKAFTVTFVPFSYPPDASNYLWRIEASVNLVDWVVLMKNCGWPPSPDRDIWVTNNGTDAYFVRPVRQNGPE